MELSITRPRLLSTALLLALVTTGCGPPRSDSASPGKTIADVQHKKGPTEEQIQQIVAKAVERAAEPPQYVQHIPSPDGSKQFALYCDIAGFDDLTWYVLKLDRNVDAIRIEIPKGFTNATTSQEREWLNKTLFWNWSEAGHHRDNPHLRLVDDRYLVFVRGGLNHALYDITDNAVLIAEESPWHGLVYSDEYEAINPPPTDDVEAKMMDTWVRENLHDPIERIIGEQ